jgi:CRISPR-associated protein Cas1
MTGFGLRLKVEHDHLCAEWGIGEDRHHARIPRINRNLRRIVVIGSDGFATFDAIRWVSDIGASLVFIDRRGKLLFASTPTATSDVRLRRAQCLALENGTALRISRELISQKLAGQAAIVRDMLGNSVAADAILRLKGQLAETDDIDSVRLVEAQGAKVFWSQFADVPIRWPMKDEGRIGAHWKLFGSRISPLTHSQRLAINPPNAVMNLIHSLCEAECRIALIAMGLDHEIGLLHCDAPYRSSLAHDVQEVLRPRVDAFVLNWIQTERFRKADFWEDRNGNCRIVSFLAKRLCETTNTWRKLAAPVAEWVAQSLWESIRKPRSETHQIPTRLTQQRRTEGRGRQYIPAANPAPSPQTICQNCGALTLGGRHCRKCGKEVSGRKLTELAKLGRTVAVGPEAQMKRSDTQHRHEAAKRSWRESPDENWNDPQRYETEIQPRLAMVKIASIALALGVSEPYAADIRAGRRRPHPRHWQVLAKLVGVWEL